MEQFEGRVWVLGDDVDTDIIIPTLFPQIVPLLLLPILFLSPPPRLVNLLPPFMLPCRGFRSVP